MMFSVQAMGAKNEPRYSIDFSTQEEGLLDCAGHRSVKPSLFEIVFWMSLSVSPNPTSRFPRSPLRMVFMNHIQIQSLNKHD